MFVWHIRSATIVAATVVVMIVGSVAASTSAGRQQDDRSTPEDVFDTLFVEGQVVYGTVCVSCHDADGGHGSAPALNLHPAMGARDHIVRQILRGNAEKGMPGFADTLSDRRVAAVATYIRNAWDNTHGIVLEGDVKKVRDEPRP
jgi:mono/diheme cytochrome c family protein